MYSKTFYSAWKKFLFWYVIYANVLVQIFLPDGTKIDMTEIQTLL